MSKKGSSDAPGRTVVLTDLLSPRNMHVSAKALQNIPIRNWGTGSPLKFKPDGTLQTPMKVDDEYDDDSLIEGLMDDYFASSPGAEMNPEAPDAVLFGEVVDAEVQLMEKYLEMQEEYGDQANEDYVDDEGNEDYDEEDAEEYEEEFEEDENDADDNDADPRATNESYDNMFKLSNYHDDNKRVSTKSVSYAEEEEEEGDDDDEEGDDEEEEEEEEEEEGSDQDVEDIVNDYSALMEYMRSPREEKEAKMNPIVRNNKKGSQMGAVSNLLAAFSADAEAEVEREDNFMNDNDNISNALKAIAQIKSQQQRKTKKTQDPSQNQRLKGKVKSSGYNNSKKGTQKKTSKSASLVTNKQKNILAEMAQKRREQEEELAEMARQAQEKRKKFKEALLEKALRARQQSSDDLDDPKPSLLKETVAFKSQAIKKSDQKNSMTDEEAARLEEQKREYIASVRRKFKEQHKKTLMTLVEKNREQSQKIEEEKQLNEKKREKRRQKILKMLAEKESSMENRVDELGEEPLPEPPAGGTFISEKSVAGSGLAVVRQRSLTNASNNNTFPRSAGTQTEQQNSVLAVSQHTKHSSEEALDAKPSTKSAAPKKPQIVSKAQQEKLADFLLNLADQKKREEMEKQKLEERKKRRMMLLSQRILQEASERKLMNFEDLPKHQTSNSAADIAEEKSEKASKKITPEMADAIAKRLGMKGKSSGAAEDVAAVAIAGEKPNSRRREKASKESKDTKEYKEAKEVKQVHRESKEQRDSHDQRDSKDIKERRPALAGGVAAAPRSDLTESMGSSVPARDFKDWKRKNGVPQDAKVFAMTGWYPCVKQALLDRGWYFNSDPTSTFFHLKWTLRSIDVAQDTLEPWQLTNHYLKNIAITTKAGLIKSLQSMVWMADVDANDIIPRAYDLSINHDAQAFIDDFRTQRAESLLKHFYFKLTGLECPVPHELNAVYIAPCLSARSGSRAASRGGASRSKSSAGARNVGGPDESSSSVVDEYSEPEQIIPPVPSNKGEDINTLSVNSIVFEAACRVLESKLRPYDDGYLDEVDRGDDKLISPLEWELIENYDLYSSIKSLPEKAPEPVDAFLNEKEPEYDGSRASQNALREKKRIQKLMDEDRDEASENIHKIRPVTLEDLGRVHRILARLYYLQGNQNGLNGKCNNAQNMWIVKPAAKSRGRGITTFADLPKLLKYVEAGSGLSTQWIVQKYMENPLVIANRKFDLRQWVLVYDWNPLTIYFYDEFYSRFSVEEYSIDSTDLDNCYIHLVNNSIGKNSENFGKTVSVEGCDTIEGYMWSHQSFKQFVEKTTGKDLVTSKIQPRMKDIAKWALMCGSEMIEHRKNSWELYGFDYMIDDEYNAWLIEINSSPACDYSTSVTERYVQKALVELLSVVLDVREWETQPKKTRGEKPETGGWECIYQGPLLELPAGSFGTDMSLKGEPYKNINKRAFVAPPVIAPSVMGASGAGLTGSYNATAATGAARAASMPLAGQSSRNFRAKVVEERKEHTNAQSQAAVRGGREAPSGPSSSHGNTAAEDKESKDNFDDSDDEYPSKEKSEKDSSKRIKDGANKPSSSAPFSRGRSKNNLGTSMNPSGGGSTATATAAIPVKVFNVDF